MSLKLLSSKSFYIIVHKIMPNVVIAPLWKTSKEEKISEIEQIICQKVSFRHLNNFKWFLLIFFKINQ